MTVSRVLSISLVVLASACAPSLQEQSAKWIDCPPSDIHIDYEERSGPRRTWTASCKGASYSCESTPAESECKRFDVATGGAAPGAAATPAAPAARAWRPFAVKDCGMKVTLPGTPAEERSTMKAGATEIPVYQAHVELKGTDASVSVTCLNLPAGVAADKLLDGARDGMIRTLEGKLVREELLTPPLSGRDLRVAVSGDEVRARMIVQDGRLVTLTLAPTSAFSVAEADQFFLPTFDKPAAK